MRIAESDWKAFKRIRILALERFSQRVIDDCQRICRDESLTAYEKYGDLYQLLRERNREMSTAFDDLRRSTAALCLMLMRRHGLVTDEEVMEFSPDIQRATELD